MQVSYGEYVFKAESGVLARLARAASGPPGQLPLGRARPLLTGLMLRGLIRFLLHRKSGHKLTDLSSLKHVKSIRTRVEKTCK